MGLRPRGPLPGRSARTPSSRSPMARAPSSPPGRRRSPTPPPRSGRTPTGSIPSRTPHTCCSRPKSKRSRASTRSCGPLCSTHCERPFSLYLATPHLTEPFAARRLTRRDPALSVRGPTGTSPRGLWSRYCAAVPLHRFRGPGTPAMHPAVDHPEADQNKHRSTDGPTHGGTIAIVPDAYGEKENGQGQSRPVEGPVQSVGYRRLVHSMILADACDPQQMRARSEGRRLFRSLVRGPLRGHTARGRHRGLPPLRQGSAVRWGEGRDGAPQGRGAPARDHHHPYADPARTRHRQGLRLRARRLHPGGSRRTGRETRRRARRGQRPRRTPPPTASASPKGWPPSASATRHTCSPSRESARLRYIAAVRATPEAPRISPGGLWPAVHSAGFEPATF